MDDLLKVPNHWHLCSLRMVDLVLGDLQDSGLKRFVDSR